MPLIILRLLLALSSKYCRHRTEETFCVPIHSLLDATTHLLEEITWLWLASSLIGVRLRLTSLRFWFCFLLILIL
jgi:hypothetical protein